MFEDDEFDAWDEEPEEPFEAEVDSLDPIDDAESDPEPGDFWIDRDDSAEA
jgi:hypothetical protein